MSRHAFAFFASAWPLRIGLLSLCAITGPAAADDAGPERLAQSGPKPFEFSTMPAPGFGPQTMVFVDHELGGERVVKGAPYCADAINESVQTLADGNRITRSSTTRQCRDGEGRTRQEIATGGHTRVFLRDPVLQKHWLLEGERKVATELGGARHRDAAERATQRIARVHESRPGGSAAGSPPTLPVLPVPALPAVVNVAPVPPFAPIPPAVGWLSDRLAPRGRSVVTPLGSKEIDGVKVNGERHTWTIEAGRIGNEKPIVTTREVWSSPDLLLTVQSRDLDPRTGEVIYRLANLKRGEPDPSLMKIPADYRPRRNE